MPLQDVSIENDDTSMIKKILQQYMSKTIFYPKGNKRGLG